MSKMHEYDPELTDLVFDYMRNRLANDVPLDHPGDTHQVLSALNGLLTEEGRPAKDVA